MCAKSIDSFGGGWGDNNLLYLSENDHFLDYFIHDAGNFLSVTRNWGAGDKLTLELPISLRTEDIKGIFIVDGPLKQFMQIPIPSIPFFFLNSCKLF